MKTKTTRQLAKDFITKNNAAHNACVKAQASKAGTPESFILSAKADKASAAQNKAYKALGDALGHAPDMQEIETILSEWEKITLSVTTGEPRILVSHWIEGLTLTSAIVFQTINQGVIFGDKVKKWLDLVDDEVLHIAVDASALYLTGKNCRAEFRFQPIQHGIERLARVSL